MHKLFVDDARRFRIHQDIASISAALRFSSALRHTTSSATCYLLSATKVNSCFVRNEKVFTKDKIIRKDFNNNNSMFENAIIHCNKKV